jgi:hypothetical protein
MIQKHGCLGHTSKQHTVLAALLRRRIADAVRSRLVQADKNSNSEAGITSLQLQLLHAVLSLLLLLMHCMHVLLF